MKGECKSVFSVITPSSLFFDVPCWRFTLMTRIDLLELENREEELSGRIEVLDKLRTSIRESEREQREAKKRYREQVSRDSCALSVLSSLDC